MEALLFASGVASMGIGAASVIYWQKKNSLTWRFFIAGGFIWLVALFIKLAADFGIKSAESSFFSGTGIIGSVVFVSALMGIRAGLADNGLQYLVMKNYAPLSRMDYKQCMAFALGFGGAEAAALGAFSISAAAVSALFPGMAALSSFPSSYSFYAAFVAGRATALLVHALAALLVLYSVRTNSIMYFIGAFFLKAAISSISYGTLRVMAIANASSPLSEFPMIVAGAAALWLIPWMKERVESGCERINEAALTKIAVVLAASILVIVAAVVIYSQYHSAKIEKVPVPAELKGAVISGIEGKYEFYQGDEFIGFDRFVISPPIDYAGETAFVVIESNEADSGSIKQKVSGKLIVNSMGLPMRYESNITINGKTTSVFVDFYGDGGILEKIEENGNYTFIEEKSEGPVFIAANNMVSHWLIIFRSIKLEENSSYIINVFSPNIGKIVPVTLKVGTFNETIEIDNQQFRVAHITDSLGMNHYVTKEGQLVRSWKDGFKSMYTLMDIF